MKIKVLGAHNTESNSTRYMSLLIDGILALDAGGLTSGISFEDQMKLKAVLLTHGHYDHIRDIPALAINLYLRNSTLDIYSHQPVIDNLTRYLLNGELYPEFHKRPEDHPTVRLHVLENLRQFRIEGYSVLPVRVNHSIPTMGYELTSVNGKRIFYTGDTGADLEGLWRQISPELLFIEVTASNNWAESARKSGHLTPGFLERELTAFKKIKGYLPQVIAVHINPPDEEDIRSELAAVAKSLGTDVRLAYEGMELSF